MRCAGPTASTGPTNAWWCSPSTPTPLIGCSVSWSSAATPTIWPSSRDRRSRKTASTSARSSPPIRQRNRCGCCWPPTRRAKALTSRPIVTAWSIFDIPFNPSRLEQRIGRIDRYGQTEEPEVYHFPPDTTASTYAADADLRAASPRRSPRLSTTLARSIKSSALISSSTSPAVRPAKRKAKGVDANEVINSALAGGMELNARLTQLEQEFDSSRAELHLQPANLRRVVDTALEMNHQPALIPVGDDRTDAEVFHLPSLTVGWQDAPQGTRHPPESGRAAPDHLRSGGRRRPQRPRLRPSRPPDRAESPTPAAPFTLECRCAAEPGYRGRGRRSSRVFVAAVTAWCWSAAADSGCTKTFS